MLGSLLTANRHLKCEFEIGCLHYYQLIWHHRCFLSFKSWGKKYSTDIYHLHQELFYGSSIFVCSHSSSHLLHNHVLFWSKNKVLEYVSPRFTARNGSWPSQCLTVKSHEKLFLKHLGKVSKEPSMLLAMRIWLHWLKFFIPPKDRAFAHRPMMFAENTAAWV